MSWGKTLKFQTYLSQTVCLAISLKYISLQIDLIKQSLTWLDKGGILIYAVCSLQKKEGEEQIKSILQTEGSVKILPIKPSEVLAFSQAITKEG